MVREQNTKSGVEKRLVRRLQKANGRNYTACLRMLEEISPDARVEYVKQQEDKNA